MLERLADLQHEIWSHWMKYLFSVSIENDDGTVTLSADKVGRWKRQMLTPYKDLSSREQKSDIEQARKILNIIKGNDNH